MEEGRQKSKILSYTAKFKHEGIRCAEDKGNHKAAAIFGFDESNIWLWRKHKAAISRCEASWKKFTGPKKGRFPEIDDAVLKFFHERCKTGLFVSYALLRKEMIKKAGCLNIPPSCFKASKGWAIRFRRQMGLALQHRTMICQKLPKDFEQKFLNYQWYITNLRKTGNFRMGQMATADETVIYLDMLPNYTEKKGMKEVLLKTTGCEKLRLTVMLAATADGRKLPPLL